MKNSILALSMLGLVFASCNKDKNEEVTPTKENLTGSFKITAMTYAGMNVFNNADENANFFEPCERDDVYNLKADLTGELTDAGTQCSPPSSGTGTWSLTGTTFSIVDVAAVDISGTIKSWNGKTLVIEESNGSVTGTITLEKQ